MKNGIKFGEVFGRLLEDKRITISDVSRSLGISRTTLSDWKNGKVFPHRLEEVRKLAQFFCVSLEYLLFGEEDSGNRLISDELPSKVIADGIYKIRVEKLRDAGEK